MIYFMAPGEGARFIKIKRSSCKPRTIINRLKRSGLDFVLVFKCGIVYDSMLGKRGYKPYRNGRELGKVTYKHLMTLDLACETVL